MEVYMLLQVSKTAHRVMDSTLTGCFLLVWLICWPFYRLYRSHSVH